MERDRIKWLKDREKDRSDLPPGWERRWEANDTPGSRWVLYLVRPEIRIVEDCNPEADVAKYKTEDAVDWAWGHHWEESDESFRREENDD